MALILASPCSGKTRYVRRNKDTSLLFVDGDDLIPIPKDRPDPSHWTSKERQAHMQGFQTYIMQNQKSICVGFSEVCIETFDTKGINTIVVEVPEEDFNRYVQCRHQNLRKGCKPRPDEYYESQRVYLRKLADVHGLRVYTSFETAVATLKDTLPYVYSPPSNSNTKIKDMINQHGFCIIPNVLPRGLINELEMKRSALYDANTKLSKHLSTSTTNGSSSTPLKDTIHQYLNPHLYHDDPSKSTFHVAKHLLPLMNSLLDVRVGEHAYLFNDTLLTKTKDHKTRLHWHQVRLILIVYDCDCDKDDTDFISTDTVSLLSIT